MSIFFNPEKLDKENNEASSVPDYGIVEVKKYVSEESNPYVKKYKSVVKEYHRKYHS